MTSGRAAISSSRAGTVPPGHRPLGVDRLLAAGVVDSAGLAFGWTVFLLAATERGGLGAAAALSAAMLAGIALSAPFSGWLSARLPSGLLLRVLAVTEGSCRLGLFVLLGLNAPVRAMACVAVVMNALAFSAYAAMRAEVVRAQSDGDPGRFVTWYAVGVAGTEALAAGIASVVVSRAPDRPVMLLIAALYALSLAPQWYVGGRVRPPALPGGPGPSVRRAVLAPSALGAGVTVLAATPTLMAAVLAFELHGPAGVVVAAVAFAAGSLGSTWARDRLDRWTPGIAGLLVLGALMVGGWSLSGLGLAGLAIAQLASGLAQCTLEGRLDTQIATRVDLAALGPALAIGSSCRALGGALGVACLPALLGVTTLPRASGLLGAGFVLAAGVALVAGRAAAREVAMPRLGLLRPAARPEDAVLDMLRQWSVGIPERG